MFPPGNKTLKLTTQLHKNQEGKNVKVLMKRKFF